MRYVVLILVVLALNALIGMSFLGSLAVAIWLWYVVELFENANQRIAFKEFILCLYGMNYLFSPAFSYLSGNEGFYRMKLAEENYFILAIPCILLLHLGLNSIKTKIFEVDFRTVQLQSQLNQQILVSWVYAGCLMVVLNGFIPAELGFFFYLLSGIRFVAAYGLYAMNRSRFKWHIGGVLALEIFMALKQGMFHDLMMWLIFFGLFWIYLKKPGRNLKLVLALCAILGVYVLQIAKSEYRAMSGSGEAGLSTLQEAVEKNMNTDQGLFNASNTAGTISRVNQAWIFASTVNRMNVHQNYQGLDLIKIYAEAAFLPRFLAPNKLKAGDKAIFNKFSGHSVNAGTSMGLGFFADGYIAYGQMGTYCFAFVLGLIFALIFKVVEIWSRVSPFFILLMFPILSYAVRPDCETQTVMGHIVKGLFVYGLLMWYYQEYFSRVVHDVKLSEQKLAAWRSLTQKKAVVK